MKFKRLLAAVLTVITLISVMAIFPSATSKSKTSKNSALGATIRSDVWIQTFSDLDGSGQFQVTAAYNSTKSQYARPAWIKTSWDFYAIGICAGVSYKGISASVSGHGYTSTSAGYWKNSNGAQTAWWRGRVAATGFTLYVGLYNTATAYKAGTTISTTAKV